MPRPKRPLGQPTRGKTALNRLRQVDTYIALAWSHVLSYGSPLVVDVGYGAQAWTALEMVERWLPFNSRLRLLGVEIDPERVAAAQPYVQPGVIDFKLGGFNLTEVLGGEKARIIRAYNVLRQYDESAVKDALDTMAQSLEPGGILIEGTSNPTGRIVAFDIYPNLSQIGLSDGYTHAELVFGTNFRDAVEPVHFQAILPKRLIHHAFDETPARFFTAWERAFQLAKGAGKTGQRERWIYAVNALRHQLGYPVDTRERIVRRGFLVLRDSLL
jgi:hypothetical protein